MSIILADGQYTAVTEDVSLLPVPGKQYYYKNIGISQITVTYGSNTQFLEPDELGIWVYDGTYWSDLTPKVTTFAEVSMDDGETYQLANTLTHIHVTTTTANKTITLEASPNDGDAANVYVTGEYEVNILGVGTETLVADAETPVRVETVSGELKQVQTGGGGAGTSVSVYDVDFEVTETDRFVIAIDDDGNIVKADKAYSETETNSYQVLGITSDAKENPLETISTPDAWTDTNVTIVSSDVGEITFTSAYEGASSAYALCTLGASYTTGSKIVFNLDTDNDIAVGYADLVDVVLLNQDGTYTDGTNITVSSYTAVGDGTYNVELTVSDTFSEIYVGNWVGGENNIALTNIYIEDITVLPTYEITVQKIAVLDGFTGLTVGAPVYLGDDGAYTQTIGDVLDTDMLMLIGYGVTTTSVDIQLGEPILRSIANDANAEDIAQNTSDIATNTGNISTNTSDIATNTGNISTNTDNIADNTTTIDQILSGTAQALLGQEVSLPYSEDLSQYGLLQYTFDKVSTGLYPEWYAKIGDTFEQQHIDAGQDASGEGYFYPTPVPGAYNRCGLPEIEFTDAEINTSTNTLELPQDWVNQNRRWGTAFMFKLVSGTLPTGISEDTIYYAEFRDTTDGHVRLYTTEDGAIGSTGTRVSFTDSGSGSFKLTQAGLSLDDVFQGHSHEVDYENNGTNGGGLSLTRGTNTTGTTSTPVFVKDPITDGTNGTPRISNETRPVTNIEFKYLKVEYVIPFTGDPVSGVKYDTGDVSLSDFRSQNLVISHNLDSDFCDLEIKLFAKSDDTSGLYTVVRQAVVTRDDTTVRDAGFSLEEIDNNSFQISTGTQGLYYVNPSTHVITAFSSETNGYYRVIVEKKNYSSPILDQPKYTNQEYTLGDGDSISLTAQTSIITVNPTADMSFSVSGFSYNGHRVIVKNISDYKCAIVDNTGTGGWLKNATVPAGQSATFDVANDQLTEGDLAFVWLLGTDITLENGWAVYSASEWTARIIKQCGSCSMHGLIDATSAISGTLFALPTDLIPQYSVMASAYTSDGTVRRLNVNDTGLVNYTAYGASWHSVQISWTPKL